MSLAGLRLQLLQHEGIHKRIAVKAGITMESLYRILNEFVENESVVEIATEELTRVENERAIWIQKEKDRINNK